jgi:flagellar biosynthesis/type III secretory pathway protein FliH
MKGVSPMEMVKEEFTEEDVEAARDEGYNAGYEDGLTEGRDEGYDDGYAAGESANSYEYEKDQLYDLIANDLSAVESYMYWLLKSLDSNPDLTKILDSIQRIIKDAENV